MDIVASIIVLTATSAEVFQLTTNLHEIVACEVCGNAHLAAVLDLGMHPMCDDLVAVGDPRRCREFPIDILYCDKCHTAHQRHQVPKRELFPVTYHYRSRFTADVLKGMERLVQSCELRFGSVSGKTVLDVGCNDGSLLSFFKERGAVTIGVEPTGAHDEARRQGHRIFNDFLSEDVAAQVLTAHGAPDFIVFTNVFAHIEDLQQVIRSLKILLGPKTIIVIENHYLGSVLDGNQFDTFYHEHPRTYSYTSFLHIAETLGLPVSDVEFPSRYGGNICVFLGGRLHGIENSIDRVELTRRESFFPSKFEGMREGINRWRLRKRELLVELAGRVGKLRAKAFPGRAAILVKLLGLDETVIEAVHEKPGSLKIGHYVPGTRVPIVSDDELFALPVQTSPILNLAWHIPDEIRTYLVKNGYSGPIVNIVDADDFRPLT